MLKNMYCFKNCTEVNEIILKEKFESKLEITCVNNRGRDIEDW